MRRYTWLLLLLLIAGSAHGTTTVAGINGFAFGSSTGKMTKMNGITIGQATGNWNAWDSLMVPLGIQAETATYAARVTADGGTVINLAAVDAAIYHAKTNSYYANILFLGSSEYGVKLDGSNGVMTLYDAGPSAHDATQTVVNRRYVWTANVQNGLSALVGTRAKLSSLNFGTVFLNLDTQSWLVALASKGTVSGQSTIFAASKYDGTNMLGYMFDPSQGLWFVDDQTMYNDNWTTFANLPSPVILTSVLTFPTSKHYLNAGAATTFSDGSIHYNQSGNWNLHIGLADDSSKPWDGKICTILFTNIAWSDTLRNSIRNFYNGVLAMY